jgi:hypothetical protein
MAKRSSPHGAHAKTSANGKSARSGIPTPRTSKSVTRLTVENPVPAYAIARANREDSVGEMMLALGGLPEALEKKDPGLAVNRLAAAVTSGMDRTADPHPANILAMMRLVDVITNTEGDIWNTVSIPAEVMLKPIRVDCSDKGAKKVWQQLWTEVLDIDALYREIYFATELYGQCFPLEVWRGQDLEGIVSLEPTSVWVGRHLSHIGGRYSLMLPNEFDLAKLKDTVHPMVYDSFVTDQNISTIPAHRVEIKPDVLKPITGFKLQYQRYAIPHIARASRNTMNRMMLDEYRRATVESFLAQLWMFTVGDEKWQATPKKVQRVRELVEQAFQNHMGALVFDHTVKAEALAPEKLDTLLANDVWDRTTQAIFRDLGFSMFILSGEVPGLSGRGGGTQVGVDLQLAIERWQYKQGMVIAWLGYLSKKFAKAQTDAALLNFLPKFLIQKIGVQQSTIIKERIMPMVTAGKLSTQTALEEAGYDYDTELERKKEGEKDEHFFLPPPSFNQMTVGPDGKPLNNFSGPGGRPNDAQRAAKPGNGASKMNASLDMRGAAFDWQAEIEREYDRVIQGELAPGAWGAWMEKELLLRGIKEFQNGYRDWGGLSAPDPSFLLNAPQGPPFHIEQLKSFVAELETMDAAAKLVQRFRALMYAGAVNLAFILGMQQAFRDHGATGWQRVLHPELSASGPCAQCAADASVVHPMDEPFFEYHPNGVCAPHSVQFSFWEGVAPRVAPAPSFGVRFQRFPLA